MYEEFLGHFGLTRNPFQVSPNPAGFYSTPAHDEALLQMVSRIEARQGFMILTGEAGTGKTIVLRYLLDWLRKYSYSTAYVFHPLYRSADLLELILNDFGVPCQSRSKKELLLALKNWLIDRHTMGDCPVIIIDEAQALKGRTLRKLCSLLKFEVQGARLVQLVLAGQPGLANKLNRPSLACLRNQMTYHCVLPVLNETETASYIATRLTSAGAADARAFAGESVQEVFRYSRGIPRLINLLCEHALLATYSDRRSIVIPGDVLRAALYFDLYQESESDKGKAPAAAFSSLVRFPRPEATPAESASYLAQQEPVSLLRVKPRAADSERPTLAASTTTVAVLEAPPAREQATEAGPSLMERAYEPVAVASSPVLIPECAVSRAYGEAPIPIGQAAQKVNAVPLELAPERVAPSGLVSDSAEASVRATTAAVVETEPIVAVILPAAAAPPWAAPRAGVSPVRTPATATARRAPVATPHRSTARPQAAARKNLLLEHVLAAPRSSRVAAAKPVEPKAKALPIRERAAVVRLLHTCAVIAQYWRAVAKSLIRDGRAFGRQCSCWLQRPVDRRSMSAMGRRALGAASSWLRHPIH